MRAPRRRAPCGKASRKGAAATLSTLCEDCGLVAAPPGVVALDGARRGLESSDEEESNPIEERNLTGVADCGSRRVRVASPDGAVRFTVLSLSFHCPFDRGKPSSAFPWPLTAFLRLSLAFHCLPPPFLGLSLPSTAFPWPLTSLDAGRAREL